jgi:hypothetical protein
MLLSTSDLSSHADHLSLRADRVMIFGLRLPAHKVLGGELPRMLKLGQHPARRVPLLEREGAFDVWPNESTFHELRQRARRGALSDANSAGSFTNGQELAAVVRSVE